MGSIARIDCDEHKDTCQRFGVSGYPTLKWFPAGQKDSPQAYDGERTLDALVDFVNANAGTKRTSSGLLDATAGHIEEFHDLISSFFSSENKEKVLGEAKALKESIGTKMAAVYNRAF